MWSLTTHPQTAQGLSDPGGPPEESNRNSRGALSDRILFLSFDTFNILGPQGPSNGHVTVIQQY